MNSLKPLFISAFSVVILAGCGTQKQAFNFSKFTPITAPVNVTKKSTLKDSELKRWSHLDIQKDTVPGMSVDRTYNELLKNKVGTKVIVGVIDSGVDIEHEDLKTVIWNNSKEIAGNGIDDDKNGYTDDVHGWNFLGDIIKEHLEYERIVNNKSLVDEKTYQEAKAENDKTIAEATMNKSRYDEMLSALISANETVAKALNKDVYTLEEVKTIETKDESLSKAKNTIQKMFSFGMSIPNLKSALESEIEKANETLEGVTNFQNYRKVLGDNPNDITDTKYGNANVMGPDKKETLHGTHVAGIIGQIRSNKLGGDGIANNVAIMAIRAVPDGDEYDKDIALAIRYAVDNGAKVINCSFGKGYSPQKHWVFDAIKYAAQKDVLIVHAAGNSSKNIDFFDNFPNDSEDKKTEIADNVLTVGALNFEYGKNIVAKFSNIGKSNVDIFAPGVQIYASIPENNYKYLQGTSMASPNAAGVAALIRSYFPKLTASQVKQIIMNSGVAIDTNVIVGGNPKDIRPFSDLSKTGKMVNAYNAFLMANKMAK
ncbi:S8 family peptidase [Flavobacterium sp. UMI-01]|uniref:S8 family peptidase n=1 Tax=Flavobacterium sp. UMI-01 TaxID=1441053 RepID=UPI001C7D2696|nr:S8 family peptidase [Flavobacterium sp. UMI-01]GIZ08008.1 peptidase S8 [Flavobacterium sp. UMI-01]